MAEDKPIYDTKAQWAAAQVQKQKERSERNTEIKNTRAAERDKIQRDHDLKRKSEFEQKRLSKEASQGFEQRDTPKATTTAQTDTGFTQRPVTPTEKTNENKTKNEAYSFSKTTAVAADSNSIKIDFNIDKSDKFKTTTESGVNTIDTINNIGSLMNNRILDGVKKSLSKMDVTASTNGTGTENRFTPISFPTLKLAKELGISPEVLDSFDEMNSLEHDVATTAKGEVKKFSERDNSLGEAWVVNPPFQFNPNDDVRSDLSFPNFGRVFNEKINNNYPVVVFEVGAIKYNTSMLSNTAFSQNDSDTGLTERIRGGDSLSLGKVIGAPVAMVGSVLRTSWKILTFAPAALLGLKKFATFSVDTGLFARYFNDIAQTLATTMGLLEPLDSQLTKDVDLSSANLDDVNKDVEEKVKSMYKNPTDITDGGAYAGIRRRIIFESVVPGKGWGGAISDFIPFLVDKDVSVSESVNNSTQSNPLAANLNAAAAEAAAAQVNNYASGPGSDFITATKDQLSERLKRFKEGFFRGEAQTVISGEGRVTLPDMWSDSSFSRSVTLNFTFTSPYGHRLAIFENTYIPFLLLFAMSMPRQIGNKTFTNPFFVRVSMKGRFFIPMGIIESLTIDRGEDKNNWTTEGVPRTMKCSITIKDLSPVMMMGLARGAFFSLFQGNDGLTSYINTLGGLSIHDIRDFGKNVDRFYKKLTQRQRGNRGADSTITDILADTFNPFSYGEPIVRGLRSSFPGKVVTKLSQVGLNPFDSTTQTDQRNY